MCKKTIRKSATKLYQNDRNSTMFVKSLKVTSVVQIFWVFGWTNSWISNHHRVAYSNIIKYCVFLTEQSYQTQSKHWECWFGRLPELLNCFVFLFVCVCVCVCVSWVFTTQSTQWGHVERGQFADLDGGWTRDLLVSSRTAHPTEPPRPVELLNWLWFTLQMKKKKI